MMAPVSGICAGCLNNITSKEYLDCIICKKRYDIECVGISQKRYHSFYANQDKKRTWKCSECISKMPKTGNLDTSLQSQTQELQNTATTPSSEINNVTVRQRREKLLPSNELSEFPISERYLTEDKLRHILSDTITTMVTAQLESLNAQFVELRESVTFYNQKYEEIKTILEEKTAVIHSLENDNLKLKSTVLDLSNRLNSVEQTMREGNIEINGIPEHKSENLANAVAQLVKVVDASITSEDVTLVTRVAKLNKNDSRPRTIVAKLRTPRHRDVILAAVTKFNKSHPNDKLNSHQLGYGGARCPVYVSEHLSPTNKSLHAATRIRAKEMGYKFTWVRNGRIFVRKDEFCESKLIRSQEDLHNVIK